MEKNTIIMIVICVMYVCLAVTLRVVLAANNFIAAALIGATMILGALLVGKIK